MYCILNAAASHLETIFVIIKFFDMIKIIKLNLQGRIQRFKEVKFEAC